MKKFVYLCLLLALFILAKSNSAQTYNGYTLYSTMNSVKAYLLDMNGSIYHTWSFPSNKKTGYSTYMLQDGVLLRSVAKTGNSFSGGPICGEVQKVDYNGNVLWDFVYSTTDYCTHHDICGMPNGNVLLIAYERKTATQATQAGSSSSIEIWSEKIVEVQPTGANSGTVVWEWHLWDHLCQNLYPAKDNYVTTILEHPELMNINCGTQKDWIHMNGIDYNAELDQITFSSHNMNEIYVIDHSTTTAEAATHTGGNSGKGGDFLYRWGKPANYGATGTTNFNVVHDAHWVSSSNTYFPNYLVGFNNKGGTGGKTCVDIIEPPYSGFNYISTPGSAYAPSTYAWRATYSGQFTSNNGNSQQLPNGNTLICVGLSGVIVEVDYSGNVVWTKSVGSALVHAYRFPLDFLTGVEDISGNTADLSVYPNPSNGLIHVSGTKTYGDFQYQVFDSFGKLVKEGSNEKMIDISSCKNGVYVLSIIANGERSISSKITLIK
jgi:hypothetical protein